MEGALALARLVQFAAAMVLVGAPAFALGLSHYCRDFAAAEPEFMRWLRRILALAAVAAILSALAWLDLEAAEMGNGWGEALDPGTVSAVLFETLFGHVWLWHLGIEAALIAALIVLRGMRAMILVLLLGAAHAVSLAWAGHAVMSGGAAPLIVQAIHLLAGGLWLGSLPALFHLLARARRTPSYALAGAVRVMLPRYSRAGYGVVSVLVLSGVGNSIYLVGSLHMLLATPYGRVLLVKIVLVAATIAVALENRTGLMPRVVAGEMAAPIAALVRTVAAEQALALLVLAAVSVLGLLPPALQQ
jgi:copper resistance protein D